ncbi:hypothetical protein V6N13_072981 [Hibiscus sabdariffa]
MPWFLGLRQRWGARFLRAANGWWIPRALCFQFLVWDHRWLKFLRLSQFCGLRRRWGGVLRDHHGAWMRGFSKFVGRCSALEAELWGIATGLRIAWDMGFRQLVVETASMDAISVLQNKLHNNNPTSLISYVRDLCQQECTVL